MAQRRRLAPRTAGHETLAAQRLAVDPKANWEYFPGSRVQTPERILGTVTAVEDGAVQGMEEYKVNLDGNMGGGWYTANQLKPVPASLAVQGTAAEDYPELSEILVSRPDPAKLQTFASANPFAKKDDDGDEDSDDKGEAKGKKDSDDDQDEDDQDEDDDAPPWAKSSSLFDSLIATAAVDSDFRFHVTSAWRDVVAKAKQIRTEGRVRVTMASDGLIFGEVKGDHHVYETGLQRLPGKTSVQSWSCGCTWGAYHWGADDDFSRFAGRMCSHALALTYEAQSRGMFGRAIEVDEHKPEWVPRRVVLRWDIDDAKNVLVRSSAKTAGYDYYGEWDGNDDDEEHESKAREWDDIHEGLDGIHRGIGVHLRPEDHAIVHDEDRPTAERAKHLLESIPRSHEGQRHGGDGNVGWHWSGNEGVGESFAEKSYDPGRSGPVTGVVFHGHTPERGDINEYPDERAGEVYGYHDHGEEEVPLHHGAHVDLKGISWKDMGREEDHPALGHPHPSGTPSMFFPYLGDFTHHEFSEHDRHHVYASGQPLLQSLARAAVAAGEDRGEVLLALAAAGVHPDQGELFDSSSYKVEKPKKRKPVKICEDCHEPRDEYHRSAHAEYMRQFQKGYTDWDEAYHRVRPTIHRGMAVDLPHDVHQVVHDKDRPVHERAHALVSHLTGSGQGLGQFYSDELPVSKNYASNSHVPGVERHTPVVFHVAKPGRRNIVTNREDLEDMGVYSYNEPNNAEIPLKHDSPVKITGVSWADPKRSSGSSENWVRHDFDNPIRHRATVNAPFGEPGGGYELPKAPGATAPRMIGENPASAGPLTGGDPDGWAKALPGTLEDRWGALREAALFEPGGVEATLDDQPEGALPATDGGIDLSGDEATSIPNQDESLTPDLTASLRKRALAEFSPAEQRALIEEGGGHLRARNLAALQIEGTHYEELEKELAKSDMDTDSGWLM